MCSENFVCQNACYFWSHLFKKYKKKINSHWERTNKTRNHPSVLTSWQVDYCLTSISLGKGLEEGSRGLTTAASWHAGFVWCRSSCNTLGSPLGFHRDLMTILKVPLAYWGYISSGGSRCCNPFRNPDSFCSYGFFFLAKYWESTYKTPVRD